MRSFRNAEKHVLAFFLFALFAFTGCGREESAQPSEGTESLPHGAPPRELPLDLQIEQKLDPLTRNDVELYLSVMRSAAERVKNPTLDDRAALEGATKILAGSVFRRIPTPEDVKTLERANLVALSMDQIVAEERKLDGRAYRSIVEAVEAVIPNPALGAASGGTSAGLTNQPRSPLEKRLGEANTANQKFLLPYRKEIQELIAVVRDPGRLPK